MNSIRDNNDEVANLQLDKSGDESEASYVSNTSQINKISQEKASVKISNRHKYAMEDIVELGNIAVKKKDYTVIRLRASTHYFYYSYL